VAYPDCTLTIKPAQMGFAEATRIIHHVPWEHPVFAQLLSDARSQFQVVICSTYECWARQGRSAYASLDLLRQLGVWWATTDEQWDINTVWQESIDVRITLRHMRLVNCYLASLQAGGKEEN
jgi:hypothetical protein